MKNVYSTKSKLEIFKTTVIEILCVYTIMNECNWK